MGKGSGSREGGTPRRTCPPSRLRSAGLPNGTAASAEIRAVEKENNKPRESQLLRIQAIYFFPSATLCSAISPPLQTEDTAAHPEDNRLLPQRGKGWLFLRRVVLATLVGRLV